MIIWWPLLVWSAWRCLTASKYLQLAWSSVFLCAVLLVFCLLTFFFLNSISKKYRKGHRKTSCTWNFITHITQPAKIEFQPGSFCLSYLLAVRGPLWLEVLGIDMLKFVMNSHYLWMAWMFFSHQKASVIHVSRPSPGTMGWSDLRQCVLFAAGKVIKNESW